jgi:peptide/nickel transport system substrate-binding protein
VQDLKIIKLCILCNPPLKNYLELHRKRKGEKMKYILPILLVIILLIPALGGCGSATTTTPAASTTAAVSTTAKPSTTVAVTTTSAPAPTTPAVTGVTPKKGGTLRSVSVAVPSVIGWPAEETGANGETPQVCFDPFLRGDVKGNIIPWVAKSYKLAEDNLSITFELRNDVYFHDGSHLTADVAKWNLDNQINAKQQPYWKDIEVAGDYSVRINFKEWRNTMFAAFIDSPATWMCSKEAFDKKGIDWMRQNPVGTGAFEFISFARDTSFIAERNPNWWNKDGGPYVNKYEILYVTDPTTELAMMQANEADYITMEPGKMAADMAKLGLTLNTGIVSIFCLVPDTNNPDSIWANEKFREAVEYSIDRNAIASNLGYGYLEAPNQLPPRGNACYDSSYAGRKYDVAKAKAALAESGYTSSMLVKIIMSPLAPSKDAVLAIQAYLAAIGVNIQLDFPEWSKYVTLLNGTWESGAALFQVFPALGGANFNATLSWYLDPTSGRLKSWKATDEWVEMLNASCRAANVDPALIRKCLNYIQDNALIIPVHESGRSYAYYPYVKGGEWMQRSMSSWQSVEKIWLDK